MKSASLGAPTDERATARRRAGWGSRRPSATRRTRRAATAATSDRRRRPTGRGPAWTTTERGRSAARPVPDVAQDGDARLTAPPACGGGPGAMKNGAPMKAVTMPTCSSPGRATRRPTTSAASSSDRGQHQRPRQDPAVVGPADGPGHVGHGEADEPDGAGGRDRGARSRTTTASADSSRVQLHPLAERAGDVVAEGQGVERREPTRGRARTPTTMNGSDLAGDGARRGRPASRRPRSGTGRASAMSSRRIAEVSDDSSGGHRRAGQGQLHRRGAARVPSSPSP